METIETFIVEDVNDNLWLLIPFLLVGAGVYFGVRTLLVQLRMIPDMFKAVAEAPAKHADHADGQAGISAFKAFTISAASRVGTGNVAGVAVAISVGGPGAVFWMWIVALLGGATAFVESTLAQLWKTRGGDAHEYHGGPAYYMTRGLRAPWLAVTFAVAISITYGLIYNALQTNSIVAALETSVNNDSVAFKAAIGFIIAAFTAVIIFGGLSRIANVTQVIVPFMAVAYILIGLLVIILNISEVPGMIATIVGHALGFREIAGAAIGAAFLQGMRRGLFSNEAGEGSAPNAAATATVSHPVKQGLVQTLGVYFDTLIVCSITAFIILLGPSSEYGAEVQGVSYTQTALADSVGDWGIHFVTFILFFLAFSSVIGNYYLAQANIEYLTEAKLPMVIFRVLVVVCVFLGGLGSVQLVWALGDTFAGIMVCINVIAIVPLGGVAIKLLRNFNEQKRRGLDPVFHRDMLPELKNVECWDGSDAATTEGAERVALLRGGKADA